MKTVEQPALSEKDFSRRITDLAKLRKWLIYHTHDSRHSPAGFPDLVLCRPPRLIFAELKTEHGKVTPEQQEWLNVLAAVAFQRAPTGFDVFVWRPSNWDSIAALLR